MSQLKILPLTRENFAPFGDLITLDGAQHFPINNGSTERFHALSQVDVGDNQGVPIISVFKGQAFSLPFTVKIMERHPLGSQSFIPINSGANDQYLVVVAKPSAPDPAVIASNLSAFIAQGFVGVTYGKGVWHHPLVSLHKNSDFLVVDRKGPGNNCDEVALAAPYFVVPAARG